MAQSQNGYKANDPGLVSKRPVPGTNVELTVCKGAPGDLLLEFAARFDAIENIDNARGHLNDWGFAERPIRGSATELSNHASGTAIDLNADHHPLGKTGTFTPGQVHRIQELLTEFDGAIRWGGNYHGRKDEMHFEIVVSPARCADVLAKVRAAHEPPPVHVVKPPARNHVTEGRSLIAAGVKELRLAKKSRTGVHSLANDVEARMNRKGTPKT